MTPKRHNNLKPLHHHAGFSLVEMVVVIGIIVLLAALVVSMAPGVINGARIRETETALKLLDTAVKEFEVSSDRKLTWGVASGDIDIPYDLTAKEQLLMLIDRIEDVAEARSILASINPDLLVQVDDPFSPTPPDTTTGLIDSWEEPIRMVHPGRIARPDWFITEDVGIVIDEDKTIRVEFDHPLIMTLDETFAHESIYGICKNQQILFVSAGPDGEFGDLSAAPDSTEFKQTQDNIYSYPPVRP